MKIISLDSNFTQIYTHDEFTQVSRTEFEKFIMSHIKHDSVLLNKDHMFDEKLLNLNDFAGYVDRYNYK